MMNRRNFVASIAGLRQVIAKPKGRPNIVLIMADDMGYSDIGCYGGEIETPNLNRLANDGVRFTHFTNTARCCPTRASLLTGMYSHQVGVGHMMGDDGIPGYRGDLSRKHATIAEALKPSGYRTGMFGKWHVCPPDMKYSYNFPMQRGFDSFFGFMHGAGSYFNPTMLVRGNEPVRAVKPDFYFTDAIASEACQFIRDREGEANPFFSYLAFTAPHWPLHAIEKDVAKYARRYEKGWQKIRAERYERMTKLGVVDKKWGVAPQDERAPSWDGVANKDWQMRRMAVYAAQVDRMDQAIGRVMDTLRKTKAMDNTLVMFLSDNGGSHEIMNERGGIAYGAATRDGQPIQRGNNGKTMPGSEDTFQSYGREWTHVSNTPFRMHKSTVYEGGISTPMITHWPSALKTRGRLEHDDGHLIDLMATCCDVAQVTAPNAIEGKSLRPLFEGRKRIGHQALFYEHEGNRAIRKQGMKLVSSAKGPWEMYNLREDRCELRNLASGSPDKVKELEKEWQSWALKSNVVPWDEILKIRAAKNPENKKAD